MVLYQLCIARNPHAGAAIARKLRAENPPFRTRLDEDMAIMYAKPIQNFDSLPL